MITDAMTARVVGLTMIVFVLIIDVSMALFSRAPGSPMFPFAFYASAPSLPFIIIGSVLIARAKKYDKA